MKKLQALDCEPKDGVFVIIMRLNFARLPLSFVLFHFLYSEISILAH